MSFTVARKPKTKTAAAAASKAHIDDTAQKSAQESKQDARIHPFFAASSKKRQREAPAEAVEDVWDQLHVVTYNVDGLDDNLIEERASEVCSIILGEEPLPDAVLLQEVVPANEQIFVRRFQASGFKAMVTGVRDASSPYFTQIFVRDRPGLVFANQASRQEFSTSQMGRDCCMVSASLRGEPIAIATAHFESLSQYSDERKQQFRWLLDQITAFDGVFVFGGDTNLREAEVKATKKAKEVSDAWVELGSPKETRFTWDLVVNTNKQMDSPSQPRARYDR